MQMQAFGIMIIGKRQILFILLCNVHLTTPKIVQNANKRQIHLFLHMSEKFEEGATIFTFDKRIKSFYFSGKICTTFTFVRSFRDCSTFYLVFSLPKHIFEVLWLPEKYFGQILYLQLDKLCFDGQRLIFYLQFSTNCGISTVLTSSSREAEWADRWDWERIRPQNLTKDLFWAAFEKIQILSSQDTVSDGLNPPTRSSTLHSIYYLSTPHSISYLSTLHSLSYPWPEIILINCIVRSQN